MSCNRFFKLSPIVFAVAFLLVYTVTGCSHSNDGLVRGGRAVDRILDKAESLMDDNAEVADSLISLIDPVSIFGKERRARYALLYTESQFKNYNSFTSDSLIMTAVHHYSVSNDIDYRFLSYYYLGCVNCELKRFTDAAVALAQAELLIDRIDNDYWKGLLYSQLGDLFDESYDYHRAEEYYKKAAGCYDNAGKVVHKFYALYDIAVCEINLRNFSVGDSLLGNVEIWATNNDYELLEACQYSKLFCSLFLNDSSIDYSELYKDYVASDEKDLDKLEYLEFLAMYYNRIHDYTKSEEYLQKAWNCELSQSDSINLYFISSSIASNRGLTNEALDSYRDYVSLQNESYIDLFSQPILGVQNEHYRVFAENEQLKSRNARTTLILSALIFALIIVIVLVTYHYKKKRIQERLYDSVSVVEELTAANHMNKHKIEKLKLEVNRQLREHYDISNSLYAVYLDSDSPDKITKQHLKVIVKGLIKNYTSLENIKKLDEILNESYDDVIVSLSKKEIGVTEKELNLFRFSVAGLSSKSVGLIINESQENVYQIKSRLLKKVRLYSEDLWSKLIEIW